MWKNIQKRVSDLPAAIKSPYFIGAVIFFVWMLGFDDNNLLSQYRKHEELADLLQKKEYYQEQIKKTDKEFAELNSNPATQEKFAREHYRMKRDNEDVFVIVPEK